MLRIILAPDSFKGTFSSSEVIEMLAEGCNRHFPGAELIRLPMADGGEGTVDAFISALGFKRMTCEVEGPLGSRVVAEWALNGETAVIEMAQASGIGLVSQKGRNPLKASSIGTGTVILNALDSGARKILIGIGGSATNDGGTGMAQCLGVRFSGAGKNPVIGNGEALAKIKEIDLAGLDPRIMECEITAICDVTNPLTGPTGATRIYGPQKGVDTEMVEILEAGMLNYRRRLTELTGVDPDILPGSGAAGGMGAAIALLLGGKLKPGIDAVLDAADFETLSTGADLIITGEGRLDEQSVFGKVPCGIARRCREKRVKVFVLAGSVSGEMGPIYETGVDGIYPVVSEPCLMEDVLEHAKEKMETAIDNMLRFIRAAKEL